MFETLLILLAAIVIMVPLTRYAGLGSILGYLLAGAAIGPSGFGLVTNVAEIGNVSELGVTMLDEDGWLFLTDRSANLIISGGVNIYPAEIESVLITHPSVGDVAVIGVPSEEWGEEVKAVVEVQPGLVGDDELAAQLIAFARERMAGYKVPRSID